MSEAANAAMNLAKDVAALEAELGAVRADRDKYKAAAEQFCAAHIGQKFSRCPACPPASLSSALGCAPGFEVEESGRMVTASELVVPATEDLAGRPLRPTKPVQAPARPPPGYYLLHYPEGSPYGGPTPCRVDAGGNVWGFSVYKGSAAYRTLGKPMVAHLMESGATVSPDVNRMTGVPQEGFEVKVDRTGRAYLVEATSKIVDTGSSLEADRVERALRGEPEVGGEPPKAQVGMVYVQAGWAHMVCSTPFAFTEDTTEVRGPWSDRVVWRRG